MHDGRISEILVKELHKEEHAEIPNGFVIKSQINNFYSWQPI